ncbi:MAG: Hint domain-containing protein [Cypionkella sp.]|uniref:Hint domain-containing protein n=1 Tax=Cypionkella sp. TaxID=2811411 RepID=UPI002ABC3B4E|nr:Hint domain-containing protein [Cypionkella sp.]MDZ4312871.1 Hint domain-containing protein [Cypionkella sp.]
MAIANELTINTSATAMDMANAIFGSGVTVTDATYTGSAVSSGIYSGATTTIAGISPTDTGVILSTGRVVDFTNSSGSTNTNTQTGLSTDTTGGVDGDAQLNAVAGQPTFDGAVLNASFIPDGDTITMQFVFASEEYPEYVAAGFNDAFGVWVNGSFVPVSISIGGNVAIDEVNAGKNRNLYHDNTSDQFNTEMDGFTYVISLKAPVNAGQVNTIKIGIADASDTAYDSNLLIMGDSIQTIALAIDDNIHITTNGTRTFDILANDTNAAGSPLTITQINGVNVVAGQTVTLLTGQQVQLNADGTITVTANGTNGAENFTYTVSDGTNTDVGYVTLTTSGTASPDGIVSGTSGNDIIDTSYAGDPDGDKVDNNDGLGVQGTMGNADLIYAGAGNDSISAGVGNDIIYGGSGNDTALGGAGDDKIYGDTGNDLIDGGAGNDLLMGEEGDDRFVLSGSFGNDTIVGGETNEITGDVLDATALTANTTLILTAPETGTLTDGSSTATLTQIEVFKLGAGNDTVSGSTGADSVDAGAGNDVIAAGAGNDTINGGAGNDSIDGGPGNDLLYGGAGNDSLVGGTGADSLFGGDDRDTFFGGAGDSIDGGEAGDDYDVLDLSSYGFAATNILYDPLNHENGTVEFLDDNGLVTGTLSFSHIEKVIACFTPGTLVLTEHGSVAVEDLAVGDLVLTRDHGFQPIRWIGRRDLSAAELAASPQFNPVCIAQGALGRGLPERDMQVSPQHRMLITTPRAELLFGETEVLAAAVHLIGMPGITRAAAERISYVHIMFDEHQLVCADGAWSESFQPGQHTLAGLDPAQRQEIFTLFPELRAGAPYPAARMMLKSKEARILLHQ